MSPPSDQSQTLSNVVFKFELEGISIDAYNNNEEPFFLLTDVMEYVGEDVTEITNEHDKDQKVHRYVDGDCKEFLTQEGFYDVLICFNLLPTSLKTHVMTSLQGKFRESGACDIQ